MAWNGSGVFVRIHNWVTDLANVIPITASRVDTDSDDFVTGLNNCLTKDGQNSATGNIDLGSNKIVSLANGTALTDAASAGQLQSNDVVYFTTTGSSNAYVLTPSPAITAYAAGQRFLINANFSNTGAATIDINSFGAKAIKKNTNQALASGDIPSGSIKEIIYDGTNFQIQNIDTSHTVDAVLFDGTNDYLTRGADLTGSADSKLITGSFWFKRTANGAAIELIYSFDNNGKISIDGSDQIAISLTVGGTPQTTITSTTTITDTTSWHHVCFSVDNADSASGRLYIDDVLDGSSWTITDVAIDYTVTDHAIGGTSAGASKLNADLAELWIAPTVYLDFGSIAQRRKFISGGLKPADLLTDGSAPTGASPIMYFSGVTASWHTNKGTGGGFTENGALTDSSTSPSD